MVIHVENEVLAHHGQTNECYISPARCHTLSMTLNHSQFIFAVYHMAEFTPDDGVH